MSAVVLAWPFSLTLFLALSTVSIASDTTTPGQSIGDGETLVSAGGNFELGFFSPGNSSKNRYLGIWYKKIPDRAVVWVANREIPLADYRGKLNLTTHGNLILVNGDGTIVWSSASSATNPVVQLLDSGNLVVKDYSSDILVWQSFDYPSDTLLSGMKLGVDFKTGLNRYLTAWRSVSDPHPGDYSYKLNPQGLPQIFIWERSELKCRSGPWNGIRFSGFPKMGSNSILSFDLISNQEEVYYTYEVNNSSIYSRFVLNPSGTAQRLFWQDYARAWNVYYYAPEDQCDNYAQCGAYGVCNNDSPICKCLKGFDPKSPQDWNMRIGSSGCVRRTAIECQRGDGFLKVTGLKLPDTSNATVDMSMGLEECGDRCLKNCSCMAYATADIRGGGSGCVIWTSDLIDIKEFTDAGQDLYIRLAASELAAGHSGKKVPMVVIVTLTIAVGMLLLVLTGCYLLRKKKKKKQGTTSEFHSSDGTEKEMQLPLFDFSTIETATNNFCNENKIGEGGFGPVYNGKLGDGQELAVKRLSKDSGQGLGEFMNEVTLIAKLQHRNLVRLLGCCIQGGERMLIYEYMQNKSLDYFIFDRRKGALLDWMKRFDILMGIARGLLYLHQDSRLRIVHRDLKASNILLDQEMNPKISDFGTARILRGDQIKDNTKNIVGTYGYMSPEYVMHGIFSMKSDIFSFGVLVLEIVSGRKNRWVCQSEHNLTLLGDAWRLWNEGRSLELLDEASCPTYNTSEVLRSIHVGLLCVQERVIDRPEMASVVFMLGSETVALPPPKKPGFDTGISSTEVDLSCYGQELYATGSVTVTVLEGR